ncbi:MAG: HAMP domain-containing histidine kinase [Eubacterium sp.]|nr:HAMP domain-containing histidine kinase [Eubacterium sp.]
MMFHLKKRIIVLAIVLYLAVFVVGAFFILIFQYSFHNNLSTEAKQYAADYATNHVIYKHYNVNLTVFLYQDGSISTLYESSNPLTANTVIKKIIYQHVTKDSFRIITYDTQAKQFLSLAGKKVYSGTDDDSMIITGHYLAYLKPIFNSFFLIYTLAYVLVLICLYVIARNNHKMHTIQNQYLANVSHELKSPISSIQAIADTLSEIDSLDEETRSKYYGIILRESRRLDHTVRDIIELSKLQDPYRLTEKHLISSGDLMEPVLARYQEWCESLDIHFVVSNSFQNLPPVYTNLELVQKLMTILLDNSMKFMESGDTLSLDACVHSDYVEIKICDTGCGIAPEHLPHIFERFYKVDDSHNLSGSGLGLSMAKEIVHRLDETIYANSTLNKGTCFTFTISRKAAKKRHKHDKNHY